MLQVDVVDSYIGVRIKLIESVKSEGLQAFRALSMVLFIGDNDGCLMGLVQEKCSCSDSTFNVHRISKKSPQTS